MSSLLRLLKHLLLSMSQPKTRNNEVFFSNEYHHRQHTSFTIFYIAAFSPVKNDMKLGEPRHFPEQPENLTRHSIFFYVLSFLEEKK